MTAPTAIGQQRRAERPAGRTTNAAATGSSRLMPRLAQRPKMSRSAEACAAGSASVSGASVRGASGTDVLKVSPYAGITRTGSSGRRRRQPSSQPGLSGLPHTVR